MSFRAAEGALKDIFDFFNVEGDVPSLEKELAKTGEEEKAEDEKSAKEGSEDNTAKEAEPEGKHKIVYHQTPSFVTVRDWCLKTGLSVYNQSISGEGALSKGNEELAFILDESISTGGEKLLLILGVRALHKQGKATGACDVEILEMAVSKSWTWAKVKERVEEVIKNIGRRPLFIISDNGSNLKRAAKELGIPHHRDISHTIGTFLEKIYKDYPEFKKFEKAMTKARLGNLLTDAAVVLPPNRRTIARFMNFFAWVAWATDMLRVYQSLSKELKKKFKFVWESRGLITELGKIMGIVRNVEKELKKDGLSVTSAKKCKDFINNEIKDENARIRELGNAIIGYIDEESKLLSGDESHDICSDVIESYFGWMKSRRTSNKLCGITSSVLLVPLRPHFQNEDGLNCVDVEKHVAGTTKKQLGEWADKYLSPSRVKKRHEILKKGNAKAA